MSTLTDALRAQHEVLLSHLGAASRLGIGTREGLHRLMQAKLALLGHLKTEDQLLYPVLKDAAKRDIRLAGILETFSSDMEDVSTLALAFFEKYERSGDDGSIAFARDFGSLAARLRIRIANEERILYPEFDRLEEQASPSRRQAV
jgi:hypothetical protein